MFKKLILLGRPASGKSEFIDFLKQTPEKERMQRYHIGPFKELDDFLWLWEKFVEDDLWEKAGHPRRYSKTAEHGYVVTDAALLDLCLEKFNHEVPKWARPEGTLFIEFSRGAGDGGYRYALNRLSDEVLADAALLFLWNTYEESARRNEARFQEKLKHTVLAHKVPEEDMVRFGKEIDWLDLTGGRSAGALQIRGNKIPFVTMENMPELTERKALEERYQDALDQLMTQQKETA